MEDTLLIKPGVARELLGGIGKNQFYKLLKDEDFPSLLVGRNYYVNKLGLQKWIESQYEKKGEY